MRAYRKCETLLSRYILLVAIGCSAQEKASIVFDVSSVKPAQDNGSRGAIRRLGPGMVSVQAMTVNEMIKLFYHVQGYQIVGGPGWIDRDRFDVTGKDSTLSGAQEKPTGDVLTTALAADDVGMREILRDHFQLGLHHESRTLPILVLLVDGKKKFSEVPCSPRYRLQHGLINGAIRTSSLASLLKAELGRPVRDSTGLSGCYLMEATWTTDLNDETLPSVPTALHKLGFRLEQSKGDVDVLVIDHLERPQPD